MKKIFLLAITTSLLLPGVIRSQTIPDSFEARMDSIFREFNTSVGPGCATAVVLNGKTIFRKDYGMANLEYDIPITGVSVFDIASVSKQFTGLAISTLIQEGKISVDDDIHKYLPDVPDFGKTITIGHLVHHTSGLRDWPHTLITAGWRADGLFSFEDIMRMVKHQKELDFEPGARYSYSNTGYVLLAAIVAKVSGKTFPGWIAENIFKPLQMNTSLVLDNPNLIIRNLAYGYEGNATGFTKAPSALTAYGSSSLFTTTGDLVKWVVNFDEQLKVRNPVYIRMLEEGKLLNGDTVHYGFGLGMGYEDKMKRIMHTGGWAGYRSIITHYPEQHLSIIILSNHGDFSPRVYSGKIADLLFQRQVKKETPVASLKNMPEVRIEKTLAEKYTGTFKLDSGWYITVTMENDVLMSRSNGEDKYPMSPRSDSVFWVDAYNNKITFVKEGKGYTIRYNSIIAKKIIYTPPGEKELKKYVGIYFSEELNTEYKIALSDGQLSIYHIRFGELRMFPEIEDGAFGCDMGTFRFLKDKRKRITGLMVSGTRIKNIRFVKR